MLTIAAILTVFIGLAHSFLGEKYILQRLFRNPLPKLFGSDQFTKNTLRFAWHITTVAWFGFAVQMVLITNADDVRSTQLLAISATFAVSAIIALVASKGRHLSWVVFSAIAALCYVAATGI